MRMSETKTCWTNQSWLVLFSGILFFANSHVTHALSRVPLAKISQIDGKPCFTVPDENDADQTVKLYAMAVTTIRNEAKNRYPDRETVWQFIVTPPGRSIDLRPNSCITYGVAPEASQEIQKALPLKYNQIYAIEISAHPKSGKSPILGYSAEFCIKPTQDGDVQVIQIPWDKAAGKWRYGLCAKP